MGEKGKAAMMKNGMEEAAKAVNKGPFKHAAKGYVFLVGLYAALYFGWISLWEDDERRLVIGADLISLVGFLIPVFCYLYVINRRSGREKIFWLLILAGQISYLMGEVGWNYYEVILNRETPYPGWPDLFYLLCPVLFIAGLVYRNHMEKSKYISIRFALDILLVMVTVSTLVIEFLISPIFLHAKVSSLYVFVSAAYPISDLGLLFGALYLWGNRSRAEMRIYYPMIGGIGMFLFADIYYLYLNSKDIFLSGTLLDFLWVFSLLLFGFSAILSASTPNEKSIPFEARKIERIEEKSYLLHLPYFFIGIIILVMVNSNAESKVVVGGCVISIFLLMIRQNLTLFDNRRLLENMKRLNEELVRVNLIAEMDANTDFLTGLYNRRCVEGVIQKLIEQEKVEKLGFSIFMIDIDWFKKINDVYGHEAGDMVLVKLAEILKGNMRSKEIVGRFGGEEFIGMLPQIGLQEAKSVAERLRNEIEENQFQIGAQRVRITVSIGIAEYSFERDDDKSSLIKRADLALYKAKNQGRNCTVAL